MSQKKSSNSFAAKLATKVILRAVTIVLIAAAVFALAAFCLSKMQAARVQNRRAAVERELSECAELVLYKMRYSDILTIKKKGAISKAFSIVRYSGVLRAGIEDIRDAEVEVSPDAKSVVVKIPPTVLLGNDIQSQEVFDEQQRLLPASERRKYSSKSTPPSARPPTKSLPTASWTTPTRAQSKSSPPS